MLLLRPVPCACSGKPASPGVTIRPSFLRAIRRRGKTIPRGMLLSFLGCRLSSLVVGCQFNQSSSPLKCSCELLAVESCCCNFVKIVNPFQDDKASDGCLATLHTSLRSSGVQVELLILKRMVSLWSVSWLGSTGLLP